MLSVLIAARNEIYLEKTIRDVLANAEGEIEIIVELDGYIPNPQIVMNDDRVIFIHNPVSIGQRQCINHAASIAKGKYIMKLDAHCVVDKGFDVKLSADCEPSWTVIPRMYNLDVEAWKPKLHKRTDYMYITSPTAEKPFRAEYYTGEEYRKWHDRKELIDDTMATMGPCWFMHKDRFFEQGGCDEGHGSWGAMSVEVALKAWLSGGSLKVNKKTWFAHWFRGDTGFPYPMSGNAVERARAYSRELFVEGKWDKAVRPLQWVVDKFNPPTWEKKEDKTLNIDDLNNLFYKHIHNKRVDCKWRGVRLIKMPTDMMLYHKVIWENQPDFIIDSGTKFGGSALFYQDMLDMIGKGGKVITIDKFPVEKKKDPRITYIEDGSTSEATLKYIRDTVKDKSVMVVLDSDHSRQHVKRELFYYSHIVTKGQYLVVEDCYMYSGGKPRLAGPGEALDWFLKRSKKLQQTNLDSVYLVGFCRGGWLRKV